MTDLNRCNKVTGIYWMKKPINKLKIKIKLKPEGGILSLPKFEEYTKGTDNINVKLEHKVEEHIFEWQEKKFNTWEIHLYSNNINCRTDREMAYHDMVKKVEQTCSKVFSYVHEDYYTPLPIDYKQKRKVSKPCLNSILQHMLLNENIPVFSGNIKSDSSLHMFKSEENICEDDEVWRAMHIVYDNSEYDEYSQLLNKEEAILISLYHNTTRNYLVVSPDTNNLEFNPYELVTEDGIHVPYRYEVEINFDDEDNGGEDLMILLKRLYKKWQKKQRQLVNFMVPPVGVKKYYVTFEIITAYGFDMNNLYIEYHVKVPDGVICKGTLQGKTHTSKSIRIDQLDQWNFGHILELELETNMDSPHIKLFFEVISIDWWHRHRTEGYSYIALSLTPGRYTKHLSCSRPEETDKVESESRRFFVGGCHLIKDLEVLAKPHLMDANFTYETTGAIKLRWDVITQNPAPGFSAPSSHTVTGTSSAVLQEADTVLRKYNKARAKLAAATKDLEVWTNDYSLGNA